MLLDELNRFGTAFKCPRFISMLRTFVSAVCRCQHWLSYAITDSGCCEASAAVAGRLLTVVLTYKRTSASELAFSSHASSVHLVIAPGFFHLIIAPGFLFISFLLSFTLFYSFHFFTCFLCPSYYCSRLPLHFFPPFLHPISLLSFLHMLLLSILLLLPASSSFLSSFSSPYFTPFLSSHASSVHLIAPFFFIISFFLLLTLFYFFPLYLPYSFTPSISSHSPIFTHYSL